MEETPNCVIKYNKRYFGAIGSILLPLAPKWRLFSLMAGGALAALIMPSLIPIVVSAASITLSVSPTLSVKVTPTATGAFATSSNGTISVESDAPFGYELGIKSGGSNALTSGANTIPSITENVDESIFKSDPKYNNTWGFKPSKWNGSDNEKYLPGPTATEPTVIDTTNIKPTGVSSYTITLGAKIDVTQPAGVYAQQFIVTATANAVSYAITYNDNGGSGGPGKVTGESVDQTITLSSKMPTREGYEFKGWCDKQTANETCSGSTYQPGGTYTLTNSANNAMLYAMWQSMSPRDLGNLGSMQTFTCSKISGIEDHGTVTDSRDNATYTVAKLKDGLCWMTQNLAIGSNSATMTLTTADSDVASNFTLPKGTNVKGTSDDTSETGGWNAGQNNTKRIWISTEGKDYGGYYSWYAATAGEGTGGTHGMASGKNTQHSICPRGWRLPTSDEITKLTQHYNATTSQQEPANFLKSGFCDGTECPRYPGSSGIWWSSTASHELNAYYLFAGSSDFYLDHGGKGNGCSVRCVSRQ